MRFHLSLGLLEPATQDRLQDRLKSFLGEARGVIPQAEGFKLVIQSETLRQVQPSVF